MKKNLLISLALGSAVLFGQRVTGSQTAEIRGGGGDGKCTIEVWVDDAAEVEIRGNRAVIRTYAGNPASIRRFQCNQAMPNNPTNFRFKGIDGRGNQQLVREPGGGGPAVVRIEDRKSGGEGYTFDIFWSGSGGNWSGNNSGYNNGGYNNGGYNNGGGYGRPGSGGYGNGGGYNGGNGGWNNGWGNGNGWVNNGSFNYEGGRRGAGSFRDQNGRRRRLDNAWVSINNNGNMTVAFDSEVGRLQFNGQVERRDGRRVFGQVSGNNMYGTMELEMSNNNTVRRINLNDVGLNWSN